MRLSRAAFPLSPVVASTRISPSATPVAGLKNNSPLFSLKVPWVVCKPATQRPVDLSLRRIEYYLQAPVLAVVLRIGKREQ